MLLIFQPFFKKTLQSSIKSIGKVIYHFCGEIVKKLTIMEWITNSHTTTTTLYPIELSIWY